MCKIGLVRTHHHKHIGSDQHRQLVYDWLHSVKMLVKSILYKVGVYT